MKFSFPAAIIFILFIGAFLNAQDTPLDKADLLTAKHKYEEALSILRDYEKSHPTDIEAHDRIRRIFTKQGKLNDLIAEYKDRFEQTPTPWNGYLYARLVPSPVERESLFNQIISKNPSFAEGHAGLATALMDQDRLQDAIDAADKGLQLAAERVELNYIKARIFRRMENYPKAAAEAREYLKLNSGESARNFAYEYEWMEVSHARNPDEQVRLADAWLEKYREDLQKDDGLDGTSRAAEICFLYAGNDHQPSRVLKLAGERSKMLANEKPPTDAEDRENFMRIKGSILALQAWAEAKIGSRDRAASFLKEAQKTGPASETFYFSALTQQELNRYHDALKNAVRAAAYPPVYKGAKELAEKLWTQYSQGDFEKALHDQREYFAPQRKKRILAQQVSENVPSFQFTNAEGKTLTKKELPGKVTLINFWAVWCPPCREELPHWSQFVTAQASNTSVQLVAVGDEPWETIQNYMKNHEYSFPVYQDQKYWDEFSVSGIPTLLVIDPKGVIRFRNSGFEEGMEYEETLRWQIEAVQH